MADNKHGNGNSANIKFWLAFFMLLIIFAAALFVQFKDDIMIVSTNASTVVAERPVSGLERLSPGDHVKEEDIRVSDEYVRLIVDNPQIAKFADTNSMDPVFDIGSNAVQLKPKSIDSISMGDIISYDSEYIDRILVHRVVEIGEDEQGWYAIAKGDNNVDNDPGRIRFEQISAVTVSIVY